MVVTIDKVLISDELAAIRQRLAGANWATRPLGRRDLQDLNGENVVECLGCDLKLELTGRALYVKAIGHCETVKDYVSREILTGIQSDTEEHIDYLETQLDLVERLGQQNYMQTAAGPIES